MCQALYYSQFRIFTPMINLKALFFLGAPPQNWVEAGYAVLRWANQRVEVVGNNVQVVEEVDRWHLAQRNTQKIIQAL